MLVLVHIFHRDLPMLEKNIENVSGNEAGASGKKNASHFVGVEFR